MEKKDTNKQTKLQEIVDTIEVVKKSGFGEVRILIRNGVVYRILKTEDILIEESTK